MNTHHINTVNRIETTFYEIPSSPTLSAGEDGVDSLSSTSRNPSFEVDFTSDQFVKILDESHRSTNDLALSNHCLEEKYCVILERNIIQAPKGSNTRYKCLYCDFEFVGGAQKIRLHLAGKREKGTCFSKCVNVPQDVRALMELRVENEKDSFSGLFEDDDPCATGLPPRNPEESHCIVLSRSANPLSKSSNSRYKCVYCRFKYIGGPQKIRVHLTGQPEGGTRVTRCTQVPPDVVYLMECRRKCIKRTNKLRLSDILSLTSLLKQDTVPSCEPFNSKTLPVLPPPPPIFSMGAFNDNVSLLPPPIQGPNAFVAPLPAEHLIGVDAYGYLSFPSHCPMNFIGIMNNADIYDFDGNHPANAFYEESMETPKLFFPSVRGSG
eukprot:scaffold504_cov189-Ochromonas_danica.AAC.52